MFFVHHSDTVVAHAPAKINLFLEVLKKRTDGYHDIVSFMVAVNLFDTLRFKEEPTEQISLVCNDASLPTGRENIVWRAAELLRRHAGVRKGVRIRLTKRIPVSAGLAGGSSDAAATLLALNRLWKTNVSKTELARLAAELGSDVPFFVSTVGSDRIHAVKDPMNRVTTNCAAWCTGRGERVRNFPWRRSLDFVLACPPVEVATAEIYRRVVVPAKPRSPRAFRQALQKHDVEELGAQLYNRLQPVAESCCPDVQTLRSLFETLDAPGHAMSGSGAAYFALCRNRRDALSVARRLRRFARSGPTHWGKELKILVVRTVNIKVPRARQSEW